MKDLSDRMPLEKLRQTDEFLRLTQKQQLFVATYCEAGMVDGRYDAISATRTAYQCKTPEIARVMSYALMANIRIIAVLNRHFGKSPIEEFIETLDRAVNNKKLTTAQLGALRLKCELLHLDTRIPQRTPVTKVLDAVIEENAERVKKAKKERKPKTEPEVAPGGYDF
jgi:hypothetical protein